MAITFQSYNSATIQDAPLVITKPTGLAVGDTMLAGIYFSDNDGSTGDSGINTPSGWTLLEATVSDVPPEKERLSVFYKEADSSDVAASNFTFTRAGTDTSYHLMGHLLRISDFGIVAGETSNANADVTTTTFTATGFTPTRANTLFVAFLGNSSTAGTITNTSVALATDNPTWTEQNEVSVSDTGTDSNFAFYTATRAAVTATGTITATMASATAKRVHLHVFSFSSQVDGSINPTTYVNAYAYNPYNPNAEADAIVDDPTTNVINNNAPTVWVNESSVSTTWTNEN